MTKKGWSINFTENGALLKHKKGQLQAKWDYNAYYVQAEVDNDALEPVIYQVDSNSPLDLYYKRLVHINKESILKTIEKSHRLKKIQRKDVELADCNACNSGKMYVIGSKKPMSDALPLSIFDINIAGLFKVKGLKRERYFLIIICKRLRAI